MRKPIPYTYVVARKRRRWTLSVIIGDGFARTLTTYKSLSRALSAARTLAMGGGEIEVCP